MDKNIKAFVVHITSFTLKMTIYLACKAQIALFLVEKLIILAKYLNFANIFSKKLAEILSKRVRVNKHAIKLKRDKQPPYRLIYSLGLVELEISKTYIKTNLANSFIKASKSLASTSILFIPKFNNSFFLFVNCKKPNNFTIKN